MKKIFLAGLASAIIIGSAAQAQQGDWIEDRLSQRCSADSRALVAAAVRTNIEESVARAEASIRAPAAIGDLSCLEALITAPLDVFSRAFNIVDDLVKGLQSGLSANILDGAIARAICSFAQQKFGSQTAALTNSMHDIVSRNTVVLPKFSDRFGIVNVGFNSNRNLGANTEIGIVPAVQQAPAQSAPALTLPQPTTTQQAPTQQAPAPQSQTERQQQLNNMWNNLSGGTGQ